ncbi:hypothetical protein [Acinetobacter sp. P1(2025)]|uniref:hypothetical protein n=1 Tax=Acinetobacter sp. P1(2025) TaxID=3446120 RepID=UPI003F53026F
MKTLNKSELKQHIEKLAQARANFSKEAFLSYIDDSEALLKRHIHTIIDGDMFGFRFTVSNDHKAIEPNAVQHLKVGQIVTFINDYGCAFPNLKVLGFDHDKYGNTVYLNTDGYWVGHQASSLVVQDGWIGITQDQIDSITQDQIDCFKPYDYEMKKEQSLLKKAS